MNAVKRISGFRSWKDWVDKEYAKESIKKININETSIPETKLKCEDKATWCYNIILQALKCYDQLDMDYQKAEFVKICHEICPQLIDHFVYMVSSCNNQKHVFDEVLSPILNKYQFDICNIKECQKCFRHWRNRQNDREIQNSDHEYVFYRDIMDQIHCIIFHLYEVGLRTKGVKKTPNNKAILKEFADYRLNNQKFNILTTNQDEPEDTFLDSFSSMLDDIDQNNMATTKQMIVEEEFDSDAIQCDIDQHLNIKCTVNDHQYKSIKEYLYDIELSKRTFSIGYRFYYWEYYKNKTEHTEDITGGRNENLHSGFKPFQLFVNTKYKSLKYEICNNKVYRLRMDQFEISFFKTTKYFFGSTKVKKFAYRYNDTDDDLHYGYNCHTYDIPISFQHLLSICVYCDWTELCTAFSATFRKQKPYEAISAVIRRNMEFSNMARLVRETVELYGSDNSKDEVVGPFYSGISHVMVIPEFNIRLNGPTSTSKQIEVAEKFGYDHGIIIQINNSNASRLRIFSCAFVSNYSEENEYLFCGGRFGAHVESIIFRENMHNMTELIQPLLYFDIMLNGMCPNKAGSDKDYLILDNLIKHNLKINKFQNLYPKYINNTFEAFTNHKKQLILNLHDVNNNKFKGLYKL
eukprot:130080_1